MILAGCDCLNWSRLKQGLQQRKSKVPPAVGETVAANHLTQFRVATVSGKHIVRPPRPDPSLAKRRTDVQSIYPRVRNHIDSADVLKCPVGRKNLIRPVAGQ